MNLRRVHPLKIFQKAIGEMSMAGGVSRSRYIFIASVIGFSGKGPSSTLSIGEIPELRLWTD